MKRLKNFTKRFLWLWVILVLICLYLVTDPSIFGLISNPDTQATIKQAAMVAAVVLVTVIAGVVLIGSASTIAIIVGLAIVGYFVYQIVKKVKTPKPEELKLKARTKSLTKAENLELAKLQVKKTGIKFTG
jgi:uncharacterized membrane protein